jgi:hypothetical protein
VCVCRQSALNHCFDIVAGVIDTSRFASITAGSSLHLCYGADVDIKAHCKAKLHAPSVELSALSSVPALVVDMRCFDSMPTQSLRATAPLSNVVVVNCGKRRHTRARASIDHNS